jgi:acyl carrier protein
MNEAEARSLILELLRDVAPGADVESLGGGDDLREALDLDSIDFLNFVTALHERTGVAVPESDYSRFFTLEEAVRYLKR